MLVRTEGLFYKKLNNKKSYTSVPQEVIDFQELINQKPYWEELVCSSSFAKKTLIICDWTIHHKLNPAQKPDTLIQAQCLLLALLTQGFIIYIWQDGDFLQLYNIEILHNRNILEEITPVPEQHIIDAATKQLHLFCDQIYLLGDYQFKNLHTQTHTPRSIPLCILQRVKHKHKKNLLEWLKTCNPAMLYIAHTKPFRETSSAEPYDNDAFLTCGIEIIPSTMPDDTLTMHRYHRAQQRMFL